MLREKAPVVAVCAKIEAEISDLPDEEKQIFLEDIGMHEPGLNRVIRAAYQLLGLETYFTAGVKEVRHGQSIKATWPPRQPESFILTSKEVSSALRPSATTTSYSTKAKRAPRKPGKLRVEGKDYVVQDGDIMNFLFNV